MKMYFLISTTLLSMGSTLALANDLIRCAQDLSGGASGNYNRLAVYQDNGTYTYDTGGNCRTTHIPFTPELCQYDKGGILERDVIDGNPTLVFHDGPVHIFPATNTLVFLDERNAKKFVFQQGECRFSNEP
jgi:hypothetical protein